MAKRVILIILGALVLLVGAAAAVGGAALIVVFGSDATASSGANHVGTHRVALVASMNHINGANDFAKAVGRVRLRLTVDSARAAFVGVGPAAAVEHYLAGAPIDRVTDFDVDPLQLNTQPRPGTVRPASPGQQRFWMVSDSGPHASVNWEIGDGDYRLVVMNADASPNVALDAQASLTIPHSFGIGLGLLIGGVVLVVLGVLLIVLGSRQPKRRVPPGQPQSISV
jgi:hypothetical protein